MWLFLGFFFLNWCAPCSSIDLLHFEAGQDAFLCWFVSQSMLCNTHGSISKCQIRFEAYFKLNWESAKNSCLHVIQFDNNNLRRVGKGQEGFEKCSVVSLVCYLCLIHSNFGGKQERNKSFS